MHIFVIPNTFKFVWHKNTIAHQFKKNKNTQPDSLWVSEDLCNIKNKSERTCK